MECVKLRFNLIVIPITRLAFFSFTLWMEDQFSENSVAGAEVALP